ncbi:sugar kinase [Prosthecochloris sp. N3]|uniref:Sugar kinase n=1 Tax=Prosthecochloris ethylica TaxID=2743976 RepID=A0ABR9XSE4_9CHLB|nr:MULTISPECIES: PfkB family carbohydrate kinase [Prosthecochloris]MEC9487041.1 PfkB family carbohydrate kinase [Prosthecochloris sp.]MBF0585383.1 sugar kinase [Prosthecochloris ethylica]MBF0636919.1 sugar kinase [Prosthecochloris ethylica]NUK46612.1 sugar kinase [Prosthecochloris ethylica]RNA64775.1 sugar kinase [Prosthecochloris sp. ZM_2]
MSILVVGSLAFDNIETPFGRSDDTLGGSSTYIALSTSYFSDDIRLVGVVGSDFGDEHFQLLRQNGIDTKGIQVVDDGKTFRWAGRYHYDMNTRDTLDTQLNVFADFDPHIPAEYREARYVCLGNIDPELQLKVLDQISKPDLVICDTMNFWIEGKPEALKKTLEQVDIFILNDSEARLLSGDPNLVKSARIIRNMGPKTLIIKKGEHGALLFTDEGIFAAPAYPLESIYDPTGAGDTFAGGFLGHLARCEEINESELRKAVLYGSAMASFCVEKFGTEKLAGLDLLEIEDRYQSFLDLSRIAD